MCHCRSMARILPSRSHIMEGIFRLTKLYQNRVMHEIRVFYLESNENDSWGLQTDWILTLNGTLRYFSHRKQGYNQSYQYHCQGWSWAGDRKAVLYPSTMRYADTLVITFSEPVNRESSWIYPRNLLSITTFHRFSRTDQPGASKLTLLFKRIGLH